MEQRRQKITEMVNREGQISFTRLKAAFPEVSEMTLRTDLKALDERKAIVRIHGGARSVDTVAGTDGFLANRTLRNQTQKEEIVRKALDFLGTASSVYLDSGSTTTLLARSIPDERRVIYTSGLTCATELANLSQAEVHMLGGKLNRYSLSVSGSRSIQELEGCHFDLCILGVTSFSPWFGFCCAVEEDCLLKQTAMRRSDQVVVLMDSGKFGLTNAQCICMAEDVDVLITDSAMSSEQRDFFKQKGVRIF